MAMDEQLAKALESIGRYLASRDHSEVELRAKLKRRYEAPTIDAALNFAKERAWLLAPELLAEKHTREFGGRKKSHRYIQGQLRRKGLPATRADATLELDKMRTLLAGKFGSVANLTYDEKTKAYRYLKYRGFEDSLIRKVLNEKMAE